MGNILTPDMVIQELQRIVEESSKAPNAIYDAECLLADREFEYERIYASAFLSAEGSVALREVLAKQEANEARLAADLAKAELNRVRNKAKQLADAGVLVATMSKNVETMYRHG